MWGVLRWLHGPFQVICVLVAVSLTAALSPLRRTGRTDERSGTSQRSSSAAGCGLALTRARQSQLLIRPFATVGPPCTATGDDTLRPSRMNAGAFFPISRWPGACARNEAIQIVYR